MMAMVALRHGEFQEEVQWRPVRHGGPHISVKEKEEKVNVEKKSASLGHGVHGNESPARMAR